MAKGDKIEIIGGREVIIAADGSACWKVDGVEVRADELTFLREIDAGEKGLDLKSAQKQNPDLLFYKHEATLTPDARPDPNPIRGFVLDVFPRPEFLDSGEEGETDEDGATREDRVRLMCSILLTKPTIVGMRGKKVRLANVGERVLMDLNHATRGIVGIAMPKFNGEQYPIALAEIAWVPKMKDSYKHVVKDGPKKGQEKTRTAWRGDLYGGFFAGGGFRVFKGDDIIKKLGSRAVTPAFLSEDDAARIAGLLPPEVPGGAPQLPEHAGAPPA